MTQPARSRTATELVDRFVQLAIAQHQTLLLIQTTKYTRLFWQMKEALDALKLLEGDQRRMLLPFLKSQNLWLRYKVGQALLALEPALARQAIESVRDSNIYPECAEAGSTLWALDEGISVPS